ncbi:hypothetical protein LSG25_06020 [Paralcaligenes sp. KSB-10]|uniref:hypothetical protein n=1 Tax=Paralcaligenes sp. KSB-10 TaxID=2901142 RepID=UPI001E65B26C|nr:hypothetical protein [Paralcaligenes sp. KSB-10]UHL65443.1 hypothetical protein LSG25_06020 [Paralcaligenes sp. KSB-10]
MSHPAFFDSARKITMQDPLAGLLGAADQGVIDYSYADAVKLAGHSCPTVAGAYLMTLAALERLYGKNLPQRGAVKVEFRADQRSGVTGVIANVVGLITGASSDNGFKGLGGLYDRRNLLFFNVPLANGDIRFQRVDSGACIELAYHPEVVPASPVVMQLLQKILGGDALESEKREFAQGWQARVERILEQADNPALITFA